MGCNIWIDGALSNSAQLNTSDSQHSQQYSITKIRTRSDSSLFVVCSNVTQIWRMHTPMGHSVFSYLIRNINILCKANNNFLPLFPLFPSFPPPPLPWGHTDLICFLNLDERWFLKFSSHLLIGPGIKLLNSLSVGVMFWNWLKAKLNSGNAPQYNWTTSTILRHPDRDNFNSSFGSWPDFKIRRISVSH